MFKSFNLAAVIIISSLLLVACGASAGPSATTAPPEIEEPPAQPEPTIAPTATEEPTPQLEPTATLEPTPSTPFLDSGQEFVFAPTSSNNWESLMIFTAGAVAAEDKYYLYYTGISRNWPEDVGIGVATSSDGVLWERTSDVPVLTSEGIEFAVQTILGSSALVQDDGTWVLYFYSIGTPDNPQQGASWIGRATADNPYGPFIADAEPVLLPGIEGAWDSFTVNDPHVIQVGDGYWMYYDGSDDDPEVTGFESIGLAFSEDGIVWTKYDDPETDDPAFAESDPIFSPNEEESAWDAERVQEPNVVQTQDGWVMLYVSDRSNNIGRKVFGIGYALSQDGIHWERGSTEPLASTAEKFWLFTISILEFDDTIHAYYSARPERSPATTNVYTLTQIGDLFP
jgi:predicted GH43/DUF377 family glycosyl hydrolase